MTRPLTAPGRLVAGRYRLRVTGPGVLPAEVRYVPVPSDEARIVVEKTNKEMESFVYTVSHDLNSPLVSISGFLNYLDADYGIGEVRFAIKTRRGELIEKLSSAEGSPEAPLPEIETPALVEVLDGPGLHEIFAARAASCPEVIALSFQGQRLSYGELERRANQVARHLRRAHVVELLFHLHLRVLGGLEQHDLVVLDDEAGEEGGAVEHAAIDAESYVVVGQGSVDELILQRPEERRERLLIRPRVERLGREARSGHRHCRTSVPWVRKRKCGCRSHGRTP